MFQSTHSLRSATHLQPFQYQSLSVSIHALLAECDNHEQSNQIARWCFNPRTPCGVRQSAKVKPINKLIVSIHALLAECD